MDTTFKLNTRWTDKGQRQMDVVVQIADKSDCLTYGTLRGQDHLASTVYHTHLFAYNSKL